MMIDPIRALYAYSRWANERILETMADISTAQLIATESTNASSLRDILVHIMSAQQVWVHRMADGTTPLALDPQDFPDIPSIQGYWTAINEQTERLLADLNETALDDPRIYTNDRGEQNTYPLWQMLIHQANHAMQHRSEVALKLTVLGHSPGWLDFLYYLDWRHRT